MLRFACGIYSISASFDLPVMYDSYVHHAALHDEMDMFSSEGTTLVVAVTEHGADWPSLVVAQKFQPGPGSGFYPGICLVPEADLLFIGAGGRLLSYDLKNWRRIWEDATDLGFWGWEQHDDVIVMSAEDEMAAWDTRGSKLWSTWVEPPWSYTVDGGVVKLDVMGRMSVFPLRAGPSRSRPWP